ncbi:MAG: DNA primase [Candidatus Edwardsbacteria bacterium RIFOXYD12_FULL_50_11]|uniref:DNA primase n=1 Tax=Candidatus Edwardsbacteria bacterium GWF2_54_11 TaxID=1817851 RepID=A0A1F5R4M2_9BACT|nr:MAG: DNA primase [Candidatus Edwardsbacteria bacterium RifOxyC12_full_54_24]OGF07347.1 MAG: DNA primase [Candidatus Edwardsbacteria bacterium RifOxyA12_full_54_48]OGF09339.1 MAG: DNA primase [Candidatus Edwardsbacteria bacterium GWF2_54_11]OGF09599.1 MAG: DNA primase [Candidatus Edwardsbacteria bacterium GWE2_54_12]OGF18042.1 MAG: DNA primase [Candidatus Edwardsbacteria bacterium RIFOXYD12_FULL_50_11]OGJ19714.1 MAG: DNA primase [Candidatus Edwardsbacteria bacterium RifOxyB12_full_52_30]HAD
MARIPEEIIDEVRQSNDVVEVLGQYLSLKKTGSTYKALCPFHQERTPSFVVTPVKQIWHCFGCGKGGNVISFLMEHDKVSFIEALRTLAKRANITLPTSDDYKEGAHDLLYQANEFAAKFFQERLASGIGTAAREYLKNRGISDQSIEFFRLGYAPNAWEDLIRAAGKGGLSLQLLKEAGLIIARDESNGYYDRFRHRIIFPIFSLSGRVIGFGGRSLEQNPQAKYLNSPETPIYHKGRGFYGFCQAKSPVQDAGKAILVEGNFDLIIPYQHGFRNILATSGTALSSDQAKLLSRYAKQAVLCYDPDAAGQNATDRAIPLLLEAGIDVKVAVLPHEMDPDLAIRREGEQAFAAIIETAITFIEFKVMRARLMSDLSQVADKSALVNNLLNLLALVSDPVRKNYYRKEIAESTGIEENFVIELIQKKDGLKPSFTSLGQEVNSENKYEKQILSILLRRPEKIVIILQELSEQKLTSEILTNLLKKLEAIYQDKGKIDGANIVLKFESNEEQTLLLDALADKETQDDSLDSAEVDDKSLFDCIDTMRQLKLKPRREAIMKELIKVKNTGDVILENKLLNEFRDLTPKRKILKTDENKQ